MEPVLVLPGEGEVITERDERSLRIKGSHELVDITETRYEPGEAGPDLHEHREHADAFYVLEGELEFRLGPGGVGSTEPPRSGDAGFAGVGAGTQRNRVVRGAPGSLVMAPAGVIHAFRNVSGSPARFLNIHAPSKGFAESLRARRDQLPYDPEQFDSFDAPAGGGRDVSAAVVRHRDEGDVVAIGASSALFKVETSDGDGTFSLTETTLEPGFPGPVPHVHERLLASFYVLEGTLTVHLDGEALEAPAGSYAFVPPGNVHTFSNPTGERVRMLNLMAPAGFEQYLKEMAATVPAGGMPDPAVMAEIASRYDFRTA